jgi:DNA-directed RNA polymerase subunit RPC12/RpoP
MSELRIIPMKCPSCGAKLEITSDMDRFVCSYCGTELITERKGGTIALKPLTDAIMRVQVGTDKTAAELAIQRLENELEQQKKDRESFSLDTRHKIDIKDANIYTLQSEMGRKSTNNAILAYILFLPVVFFVGLSIFRVHTLTETLLLGIVDFGLASVMYLLINMGYRHKTTPEIKHRQDEISSIRKNLATTLTTYDNNIAVIQKRIDEKKRIVDA